MKQIYKPLLGAAILLTTVSAKAQMTNCNVFLQGNHVEVGINPAGAYGSTINAPAGYHPRSNMYGGGASAPDYYYNPGCSSVSDTLSHNLGFVADPNLTGWGSYFGDYYLPGMPQEGWAIQVNGNMATSYTPALLAPYPGGGVIPSTLAVVPGANTAYAAAGGHISGTWVGMYDSIMITQVTTVDTGGLFFKVDVQLTNMAIAPKDNVYYMRTIDPDNEHETTGSFSTINNVEHQATTSSDLVSVSAMGETNPSSYMVLGTHDSRAKSFRIDMGLSPYNALDSIYNQTTTYNYSGIDTLDVGIGLIFNIGHLATVDSASDTVNNARTYRHPANSKSLSFVYAFKFGVVDTMGNAAIAAGVNTIGNSSALVVSPNPVHNTAQVSGLNADELVAVYDLTGREVLHYEAGNNNVLNINTEHLPTGMYLLVVKDKAGTVKNRVRMEKN